MANPTDEADRGALRLDFDRRLLLQIHGSAITSDARLLPTCVARACAKQISVGLRSGARVLKVLTCAKRLASVRSSSPCFADDAAYLSGRSTEIPLSLTWLLTGLRPEVFERVDAALISGPWLPRRRDLQYPCRLLPWPAEVRVGAPFSRPRPAVKGCWP